MGQVVGPFTWSQLQELGLCLKKGDNRLCIHPRGHRRPHYYGIVRLPGTVDPNGTFSHRYIIRNHPMAHALWHTWWSGDNGGEVSDPEGVKHTRHPGF